MATRKCSENHHTEAPSYLHQNRDDCMTSNVRYFWGQASYWPNPQHHLFQNQGSWGKIRQQGQYHNFTAGTTSWPAATFSVWKVPLAKAATVTWGNAATKHIGPSRLQGLAQVHISRGRPALKAVQLHLCITALGLVRPMNAKRIWMGRAFYQWQAKTEQV